MSELTTWDELFDRAADVDVTLEEIRDVLVTHRTDGTRAE